MLKDLFLQAALVLGQQFGPAAQPAPTHTVSNVRVYAVPSNAPANAPATAQQPIQIPAPAIKGAADDKPKEAKPAAPAAAPIVIYCENGGCQEAKCRKDCDIAWLIRWKCKDLEEKPCEPKSCKPTYKPCGLFKCPKPCEEEKKEEEKKEENGNGEAKVEEEKDPSLPLTGLLECCLPNCAKKMECNGIKTYGWLQGGFTGNFDSPRDRLNYGVNYGNRSNAVQLNQAYIVIEKALDLDKKKDQFQIGGRFDFFGGHDAPYYENFFGVFPNFLGDKNEFSRTSDIGISIPQAYLDVHMPILTERGVDVRVGRFNAICGYEVLQAPQSPFYSHQYEFFYGVAFTHVGALATVHLGDTVDVQGGWVRGWDVAFQDTNDTGTAIGSIIWNSCDKKQSLSVVGIYGPEQLNNNHNDRALITAYYSRTFGCKDQWKAVGGGHVGWEQNATLSPVRPPNSAEWYGTSGYLFYTVNPKTTLGLRAEWFHDDDGARTIFQNSDNGGATWNRPGYAGSFYEVTAGVTYKPYKNLRVRPEVRIDWFDGNAINGSTSKPFNDQRDTFQTTAGFDIIWEF